MRLSVVVAVVLVALLPAPAATSAVRKLSITSPVTAGNYARLVVSVSPRARCSIKVAYNGVSSRMAALRPKTGGRIIWRWRVPLNTPAGRWPVRVVCGKSGLLGTSVVVRAAAHVVWVVMENHSYDQIIGNTSSAPYINSLAQRYGSATNMQAESHPSLPNYIAMTSGSTQGITDDFEPSSHPLSVENIFHQLPGGRSRSLEESMPSNCYKVNSSPYAVRHNPEAYYTNLGSDCTSYDVPLGSAPDLSAAFTFITPNICHDMHTNSCPGSADPTLQGDQWLRGFVPKLLATPQYQAGNTVIFITWDEGRGSNHIPTLVLSPTTSHVQPSTAFTHYSMLRTTEEMLGLPPIGGAVSAASMRAAFHL
jgi:hypothetical protein